MVGFSIFFFFTFSIYVNHLCNYTSTSTRYSKKVECIAQSERERERWAYRYREFDRPVTAIRLDRDTVKSICIYSIKTTLKPL